MPFTIIAHGSDGKHRVEESAVIEDSELFPDCFGDTVCKITLRVSRSLMDNADFSVKKTTRPDSVDVLDANPICDARFYKAECERMREGRDKLRENRDKLARQLCELGKETQRLRNHVRKLEHEANAPAKAGWPRTVEVPGSDPMTFTVMLSDGTTRSYEVRVQCKYVRALHVTGGDISGFEESYDGANWFTVPLSRVFQAPRRDATEKSVGVLQDRVEKMTGLINRAEAALTGTGVAWEGDLEDAAKAVAAVAAAAIREAKQKARPMPSFLSDKASAMRVRESVFVRGVEHFLKEGCHQRTAVENATTLTDAAVAAFSKTNVP